MRLAVIAALLVTTSTAFADQIGDVRRWLKQGYIVEVLETAPGEAAIEVSRKFVLLPLKKQTHIVAAVCSEAMELEPDEGHSAVRDCIVEKSAMKIADVGYNDKTATIEVAWEPAYAHVVLTRDSPKPAK
jgi:hypothetical protein